MTTSLSKPDPSQAGSVPDARADRSPVGPPEPSSPAQLGFSAGPQPTAVPGSDPPPPGAPQRSRGDALVWWGFGLSFGSVLAAVAGAALALSVVGIVVARRTGRVVWPAVVGCAIAGLALGVHATLGAVHGVERVVALVGDTSATADPGAPDGSGDEPSYTDAEDDYLTAISDSQSDTYLVYTDPALVGFGHQACDAVDGGEDADQAADDLDMGRAAAAEVVQVATDVLCPAGAAPAPSAS